MFVVEFFTGSVCFNVSTIQPDLGTNFIFDRGSFMFIVESFHVFGSLFQRFGGIFSNLNHFFHVVVCGWTLCGMESFVAFTGMETMVKEKWSGFNGCMITIVETEFGNVQPSSPVVLLIIDI